MVITVSSHMGQKNLSAPLQGAIHDQVHLTAFKTVVEECGNSIPANHNQVAVLSISIAALGDSVDFVRILNVSLLVLGGGGYTIKNVSRYWTYETVVFVGSLVDEDKNQEEKDEGPETAFSGESRNDTCNPWHEYFGGDNKARSEIGFLLPFASLDPNALVVELGVVQAVQWEGRRRRSLLMDLR
ncbi:hypothetical protein EDC04DRAFT_2597877 [Pisolithus marmoratus]|nr:hypothetical protein EDC04DRAFT_2597877 [Pisolithus marmoratus]